MNRIISQVVLVIVSVALFFSFVDPLYRREDPEKPGIKVLQAEIAKYDEALDRSKELVAEKTRLVAVRASIDAESRERLEKLLPDSIDNIRLIIDINNIAKPYNLFLNDLKLTGLDETGKSDNTTAAAREAAIGGNETIGSVTLSFAVTAQYEVFKQFMRDLEKSLRLVDVTDLSLKAAEQDYYEFKVTLKTYWLR